MKTNKINAFTLAEILIVLMIIGVIAILALRNLNSNNFQKKEFQANAYKAVQEFQSASVKVREIEVEKCPTSEFTTEIMGEPEYSIYDSPSVLANTDQVLALYGNYLKMENAGLKFCNYTGAFADSYCSTGKDKIKGAKISDNMYIGLEVIADTATGVLGDCPSYYRVNPNEEVTGVGKCWGRLYVDTNGKKQPNVYGQDAFVFGLNASGVIY